MKLTLNIKPTTVTAKTKQCLLSKVNGISTFRSTNKITVDANVERYDHNIAILYRIEKRNKKTKQIKTKKKNEFGYITKSTIVQKKEWIMYVYHFPIDIAPYLGITRIVQHTDNFELKFKK